MKYANIACCGLAFSFFGQLSTIPALAQEASQCANPGLHFEPVQGTHSPALYSKDNQISHERGTTILSVTVGIDGVAADAQIVETNAVPSLNDSVIGHIKSHWRWQPPTRDCQPTTAKLMIRVIWVLAGSAALPDADFHVKMPLSTYPPGAVEKFEGGSSTLLEVETDEQSAITGGRIINSSDFSDLDVQALTIVKNSPALLKGQKAGKHIISADWSLPPTAESFETVIVIGSRR